MRIIIDGMHSNVDIMNMELKTVGERGMPMELDVISVDAYDYGFRYLHGFVDDTCSYAHTGRIERRLLMSPIIAEYHQYVMNHD